MDFLSLFNPFSSFPECRGNDTDPGFDTCADRDAYLLPSQGSEQPKSASMVEVAGDGDPTVAFGSVPTN